MNNVAAKSDHKIPVPVLVVRETISPWSLITMRTDCGPEATMPKMIAIGMIKMDRKSVVTRLNFSW